jgi:hypothetical protein
MSVHAVVAGGVLLLLQLAFWCSAGADLWRLAGRRADGSCKGVQISLQVVECKVEGHHLGVGCQACRNGAYVNSEKEQVVAVVKAAIGATTWYHFARVKHHCSSWVLYIMCCTSIMELSMFPSFRVKDVAVATTAAAQIQHR